MKRNFASWTISILSFVMMFSFTGCSQNQQLDDAKAAEKNEIVESQKTSNKTLKKPVVNYATLKVDKNQATSGDKVKVSVKIKDDDDMQSAYIYYLSGMTDNLQMIELNYNEKTKYYEGNIEILDSSESGTWKVESILTVDKRNRTTNTYNSLTVNDTTLENRQDLSSGDFTVSNTNPEYNAPKIDMSTLKVSQKSAKLGDKIKISIKITDETSIQKAIIVYKKPQSNKSETIQLTYNEKTNMMEGYYTVSETSESGIWKINYIIAHDTNYNSRTINCDWGDENDLKYFVNGDFTVEEIEE